MSDQKVRTFIQVWSISKQFFPNPIPLLLVVSTCLVLITLLSIGLPYLLKLLVDQSQIGSQVYSFDEFFHLNNLYLIALTYAVGWLMNQLLNQINVFSSSLLLRSFDSALIYEGVKNYFCLKHDVQKQQDAGVFNTNLLRGSEAFGQILYIVFFIIVPVVFQIIGMVWVLSSNVELSYGLYFLVFSVITIILSLLITFKTQDFFTAMYESRNQLNQFIIEKVQSSYDIKVNDATQYELNAFEKRIHHYIAQSRHTYIKISIFMMYQVAFVGFFLFVFMALSVYLFQHQRFTSGDFVLISTYIISLTMPLMMMSQSIIRLRGDFIALQKFYDYFNFEKDQFNQKQIESSSLFYLFKDAQLKLGAHILSNFNFKIEQGKCYVAIGRTGIGKTSFINYLMGLQHIDQGQLFYKNIDISQQFSSNIFNEIAFVSQSPIVYSGTLRQNLVHSSQQVYSDGELMRWLQDFDLIHLLEKNNIGLDDDIQDFYKSFSGGEKQRISLIRALLKKPQLIILDEPTAALDEKTSLKLMPIIRKHVSTIFMISHANYALDLADEVLDFNKLLANSDANDDISNQSVKLNKSESSNGESSNIR